MKKINAFSLITGILLLCAIILISLLTVSSLQITGGENELSARRYHELESFGDGCFEKAIFRLKQDSFFRNGSLSESDKSCTIIVEQITSTKYKISIAAANLQNQSLNISSEVVRNVSNQSIDMDILNFNTL